MRPRAAGLDAAGLRRDAREADRWSMSLRSLLAVTAFALALTVAPSVSAASSVEAYSRGTPEQIAWVRRAASNFVSAELAGNGAGACAVLAAPLRANQHHRTCAQRWSAKLARLLREPGGRTRLRGEARAIPGAAVVIHGDVARIGLPAPLLAGSYRFLWSENCWMLEH